MCLTVLVSYLNGWVGGRDGTSYGAESAMGAGAGGGSKAVAAAPLPASSFEHQKNVMLITLDDVVTPNPNSIMHQHTERSLMPMKEMRYLDQIHC